MDHALSQLHPLLSFNYCLSNVGILVYDPMVNDYMSHYFLHFMDASQVDVALGGHIVIQLSIQLGQMTSFYWYDQTVLYTDQTTGFGIVWMLPQ